MGPASRYLKLEQRGDVCCVQICCGRLDEVEIYALTEHLLNAGLARQCRRLVLSLGGANPPQLMYSIFLARLITLQRLLRERGRDLILCDAEPSIRAIFEACHLDSHFRFAPDMSAAIALPAEK